MTYTNLPPTLMEMFGSLDDRIKKLESGPSQPMYYAQSAQTTALSAQTSSAQATTAAQLAQTQATTAIALAGTKNTVFYSGTAPTANAVNDQWINTAEGNKLYIWTGSAWVSVQDTAIASAQSAASAAQTTADGKNKIYRQGTTPSGTFSVGDLWFNTSSDNAMSRWDGSSWVSTTLGTNALANFSANKITSGTIDASIVNVSNINAGNISSGSLASARIAAGTITGSQLVANTITASQIASGTITATQIATGTITATQISSSYVYAGTIAASQITAGTLTGFTIQTSSGSTAVTLDGSSNAITFKTGGSVNGTIVPYSSGGVMMTYGSSTSGTPTSVPLFYAGSSTAYFQADNSNYVSLSTTSLYYYTASGGFDSQGYVRAYGELYAAGHQTTANAANGYVFTTGGRIARSTASSLRYKENVVDLTSVSNLNPKKLLDLKVRSFTYKDGYLSKDDPRADKNIPGFIAEEVDSIYPIACDYVDGQAESWNDRMIVPAMLALIQDQEKRIKQLEGN